MWQQRVRIFRDSSSSVKSLHLFEDHIVCQCRACAKQNTPRGGGGGIWTVGTGTGSTCGWKVRLHTPERKIPVILLCSSAQDRKEDGCWGLLPDMACCLSACRLCKTHAHTHAPTHNNNNNLHNVTKSTDFLI